MFPAQTWKPLYYSDHFRTSLEHQSRTHPPIMAHKHASTTTLMSGVGYKRNGFASVALPYSIIIVARYRIKSVCPFSLLKVDSTVEIPISTLQSTSKVDTNDESSHKVKKSINILVEFFYKILIKFDFFFIF